MEVIRKTKITCTVDLRCTMQIKKLHKTGRYNWSNILQKDLNLVTGGLINKDSGKTSNNKVKTHTCTMSFTIPKYTG